jgi:hypothetical protein
MKRDSYGLCLNKSTLKSHSKAIFTRISAYSRGNNEPQVLVSIPQMSGNQLLAIIKHHSPLMWRAQYMCNPTE